MTFNALFVPADPNLPASKVPVSGRDDPQISDFLGETPCWPARTDRDAALMVGETSLLRREALNERATAYRREHSAAKRTFRDASERDGILAGNAVFIGWIEEYGPEGPDYVPCDVPDRISSHMQEQTPEEVIAAALARIGRMREERMVDMMDPAERAADERAHRSRREFTRQVERGEIEL